MSILAEEYSAAQLTARSLLTPSKAKETESLKIAFNRRGDDIHMGEKTVFEEKKYHGFKSSNLF